MPIAFSSMPRPNQIAPRKPLTEEEIKAATYVGSAEHKVQRWWGGYPQAWEKPGVVAKRPKKQHTSICRKVSEADREEASCWVRAALRSGQLRYHEGDKTYPKHIWYKDANGNFWFGFAVNEVLGTYKGWPVSEAEKREKFD